MWIIREFNYKLIEVSHVEIGMKLLKLWNLEVQFWVPILKAIGITAKIEHENELKFGPSPK